MTLSDNTYQQPEKNFVREKVIAEAVKALTSERESSPVVSISTFEKTLDYSRRFLEQLGVSKYLDGLKPEVDLWRELYASRVGEKRANELNVLFLAGPEPLNDLMTFHKLGVLFENIWAIEGDKRSFQKAVRDTGNQGIRVKLHRGSLQSFFAVVPQQFDIVYFDATAPLLGGDPNTIHVIKELFLNQRLSPLAVLITTFSEATKDSANAEGWAKRIGVWAYANGTLDDLAEGFDGFLNRRVKPNFQQYYGEFITKFLIRFAGQLVPWWRVVALPGAKREYFSDEQRLENTAAKADTPEILASSLYPMLRWALFTSSYLDAHDVVLTHLLQSHLEKARLDHVVKIVSLVRTFYEVFFDEVWGSTKHVLDACSDELARVLGKFEWFDQRARVFCDIPLPNLITDLLLGLYGFPYHANTKKIQRYAYKAKETVMFTDVLVFDQARYVYGLLPTLPLFETDFSIPRQLVLRVCIDAIHRHCHYGCDDVFWGSALASIGEEGFSHWLPTARQVVGNLGVSFQEPDADGNEVWSSS